MTTLTAFRRMPLRAAAICGLLAPITVSIGWIGGALAQPDAYSSADDDLSDLGAQTANKAWIYNQIGDNLTGILIISFGLGLDTGCTNDSWHSSAHKMNNRFTVAATIAAPFILAFAFRRIPEWRGAWLPTLAAIPVAIVCGVLFSGLGDGAAVRATTATWFVWLAFLAVVDAKGE